MAQPYQIRVLTEPTSLTNQDDVLVLDFTVALDGFLITLPDTTASQGQHYTFVQKGQPSTQNCTPALTGDDTLWSESGYQLDPVANPVSVNIVGGTRLLSVGSKAWVIFND